MTTLFSSFHFVFVFMFISSTIYATTNNGNGFSLDLIHKDSPNSPFYNPSETQADRLQKSARRYFNRIHSYNNRINKSPSSTIKPQDMPTIELYTNNGEYIVNISIGTPPVPYLAIADPGSSITWTQCKPCESCFTQTFPIFDPKLSSSYQVVECGSPACQTMSRGACGSGDQSRLCTYAVTYLHGDFTKGFVGIETLTLGSVSALNIGVGCGTNNVGHFTDYGVSGILGLDSGPASLISQLRSPINGKFSYCLVTVGKLNENRSSKMKFGTDSIVTGTGVESTPLILKPDVASWYFITLIAVRVGSENIDVTSSPTAGNLIVDAGTTYTSLPPDVFNRVADAFRRQVKSPEVNDPNNFFKLCFASKDDIVEPAFILYFPQVGLKLGTANYFFRVTEEITCFAFFPKDVAILGNLAQMNVWVGFDLQANTVSFAGADCSTH